MDKMEENNSIDRSDVQKNLYRALLEAYNSDKDILSSYGEVVTIKQGREDQDKDEEPSAGSKPWVKATKIRQGRVIKRSNSKGVKVYKFFQRYVDLTSLLVKEMVRPLNHHSIAITWLNFHRCRDKERGQCDSEREKSGVIRRQLDISHRKGVLETLFEVLDDSSNLLLSFLNAETIYISLDH
ncbi:hypothetical protein Tco_0676917 [Tanacetum coccineum]